MSIVNSFTTDGNFWETNPQLQVGGPIKVLYTSDKSRGKDVSSRLMWTIVLIWDRSSKYFNLPEDGPDSKITLLFDDFFGDVTYYKKNKAKIDEIKEFYFKLQETPAEKTLGEIESKLQERAIFLRDTPYEMGEKSDKGWLWGTVDTLDRMMANTKKLYDMYDEARKLVLQQTNADAAKGGGEESLGDKGEI